jgi:hypothetical protein
MDNVSRPLIALLVGTVAFFGVWLVALHPSSSSNSPNGSGGGVGQYQPAINAAKRAVANSYGETTGSKPTTTAAQPTSTSTAPASPAPARVTSAPTTQRLNIVQRALAQHKVIALLFYNPSGADDKAVKQELAAISTHGGRVVKLAAPLSELARYTVVTAQVPVNSSPTLVLVDPAHDAIAIAGYADSFEIAQRVDQALAIK